MVTIKSRASGGDTIDSVAVLPFVNASGNPDSEYLSDGITESLINSLSTLPHLKVMSRDSAFMYKGKDTDARTVGQALGVRAVLKGHVMQRGDDLEISAELVDARDDSHIWGQQYSRKASDIFALQNDLAKEMTSMLRMRLTGEDEKRMMKSATENPEAYQDYLKGRFWWGKGNEEGVRKSIDYYQQAIAKDPNYLALAYAGLSDGYWLLAGLTILPPKEAVPKARAAAEKRRWNWTTHWEKRTHRTPPSWECTIGTSRAPRKSSAGQLSSTQTTRMPTRCLAFCWCMRAVSTKR